jgi:SAM-dependent methyltransferase
MSKSGMTVIEQRVAAALVAGQAVRVLDAGCGSSCHLDYGPNAHVVGLDVGKDELVANERLDDRILGDVQTYPIPPGSFDVVACLDVLEHLPRAKRALTNLAQAVRPGGLLVIALPNVVTPKSVVAKFTPFWFHMWVYRRTNNPHAGEPGHGPYRTYLRWTLRPRALRRFAEENGLEVLEMELAEGSFPSQLREHYTFGYGGWQMVAWTWRMLTLGRSNPALSEVRMVMRKTSSECTGGPRMMVDIAAEVEGGSVRSSV